MYYPNLRLFPRLITRALKITLLFATFLLLHPGCQAQEQRSGQTRSARDIQEERIAARRDFLKKERAAIQAYIDDRGLHMQRSGTGLHYQFLKDSLSTQVIHEEDYVTYDYEVYSLEGELLYSSRQNGPKTLKVGRQEAVAGVHEALQLMTVGDKARFILPSHLAYGVAGDQIKVPPMSALVYELTVLKVESLK